MAALSLLFCLFLVVLLCLSALAVIMAWLQGIKLASDADNTLAFISTVLIFPPLAFGLVYWATGKDLPGQFMDDLREKQRKDEAECEGKKAAAHPPTDHT